MVSLVIRMTWITRAPGPNLHHQMHGKNHPQTNLIMASLIQWNCRGLRANFNELLLMMQNENPVAFALQELAISDSYSFQNRQYSLFSSLPIPSGTRPHGDAGILVRKNIPHSPLPLNTSLQAVACRISIPQPLTVCSIYLPPTSSWTDTDLLNLVSQLPPPVL